MPAYQNVTPPLALSSGDVGFSFNNEAFPGSATSGTQFALPSFTGTTDAGTAVRWQTIFGTNPTAVNIVLQGAMAAKRLGEVSAATCARASALPRAREFTARCAVGAVLARLSAVAKAARPGRAAGALIYL